MLSSVGPFFVNSGKYMETTDQKIALVTGANRGIGKEIARQLIAMEWRVIITGRDLPAVQQTASELGEGAIPLRLDVSNQHSVEHFMEVFLDRFDRLDALINNAGIMGSAPMSNFDLQQIGSVMDVNVMGPIRVIRAVLPRLRESDDARIINVSSGMGTISDLEQGGYGAYRLSKWSLNGLTILLNAELLGEGIKVMAMCPGWCRTGMGSSAAPRSAADGASTAVWLASSPQAESGKFYRDEQEISWT